MEKKSNVQNKVIKELKDKMTGRNEDQYQEEEPLKIVEEISI